MFNPNKSKSKIAVRSSVLAQHLLTIGSPLPKKKNGGSKKAKQSTNTDSKQILKKWSWQWKNSCAAILKWKCMKTCLFPSFHQGNDNDIQCFMGFFLPLVQDSKQPTQGGRNLIAASVMSLRPRNDRFFRDATQGVKWYPILIRSTIQEILRDSRTTQIWSKFLANQLERCGNMIPEISILQVASTIRRSFTSFRTAIKTY